MPLSRVEVVVRRGVPVVGQQEANRFTLLPEMAGGRNTSQLHQVGVSNSP